MHFSTDIEFDNLPIGGKREKEKEHSDKEYKLKYNFLLKASLLQDQSKLINTFDMQISSAGRSVEISV